MHAPLGKFSILGNHDLRTRDVARLRRAIADAGFTDVGGRVECLAEVPVLLAGNERPWFNGADPAWDHRSAERSKFCCPTRRISCPGLAGMASS